MALPPYVVTDLGYSIAMFLVGLTGLRFVLLNMWSIDILDFRALPARIAAGTVSLIMLFSLMQTFADPNKARDLGRAVVGREYAMNARRQANLVQRQSVQQQQQVADSYQSRAPAYTIRT
mgnify:CR=1 FL=1|tara:strand:+ start:131 stop:490 length:360 start_codon:yes stop_codon:yes gene_type:complete